MRGMTPCSRRGGTGRWQQTTAVRHRVLGEARILAVGRAGREGASHLVSLSVVMRYTDFPRASGQPPTPAVSWSAATATKWRVPLPVVRSSQTSRSAVVPVPVPAMAPALV